MLLSAYEGLKNAKRGFLSCGGRAPGRSRTRLVDLYDAWGKKDEAERWRKRLGDAKPDAPQPPGPPP